MIRSTTRHEKENLIDKIVSVDADIWKVLNVGNVDDDRIYLHLASTTRFNKQRNGMVAVQMADWFDIDFINSSVQ